MGREGGCWSYRLYLDLNGLMLLLHAQFPSMLLPGLTIVLKRQTLLVGWLMIVDVGLIFYFQSFVFLI